MCIINKHVAINENCESLSMHLIMQLEDSSSIPLLTANYLQANKLRKSKCACIPKCMRVCQNSVGLITLRRVPISLSYPSLSIIIHNTMLCIHVHV